MPGDVVGVKQESLLRQDPPPRREILFGEMKETRNPPAGDAHRRNRFKLFPASTHPDKYGLEDPTALQKLKRWSQLLRGHDRLADAQPLSQAHCQRLQPCLQALGFAGLLPPSRLQSHLI